MASFRGARASRHDSVSPILNARLLFFSSLDFTLPTRSNGDPARGIEITPNDDVGLRLRGRERDWRLIGEIGRESDSPSLVSRRRFPILKLRTAPMSTASQPNDVFTIERRGDVIIFTASPQVERIDFNLHNDLAQILLHPLQKLDPPLVVIDLSQVDYFGSMFLAVLLQCYKYVERAPGGALALSGVSPRAKELLRVTAVSDLLPMYDTRREAVEALLSE